VGVDLPTEALGYLPQDGILAAAGVEINGLCIHIIETVLDEARYWWSAFTLVLAAFIAHN